MMTTPNEPNADNVIAECLWQVDALFEEIGWDQPAELFAVMIQPIESEDESTGLGVVTMKPMLGWEDCNDLTLDVEGALDMLHSILVAAPTELKRLTYPLDRLYGAAIMTEAWTHDNVESRFIYAVSRSGHVSALHHERNGIAQAYDGTTGPGFDLRLPNILTKLLGELT
jgi:hypothetical protein